MTANKKLPRIIFAIALASAGAAILAQDAASGGAALGGADMDSLHAEENFRVGLDAYNRRQYQSAILSFEKALSYRPGEGIILDYMGKAYYRSGLEEIALRLWQDAALAFGMDAPETLLINNRIEVVRNRRGLFPAMNENIRYIEVGHFPGTAGGNSYFSQPSAVLSAGDGTSWVAAYGSNELIRIDVNGVIRERRRGRALEGFDRPYDIVRGVDGNIYVSEFRGGRISVLSEDGTWLSYIGSKGLNDGNLLGPANMAIDDEGYIYVVDYGNRRICKFNPDGGEFITSFGRKSDYFKGFVSPTGIAVLDGIVYVADGIAAVISMFDRNGLYLGDLLDEGLNAPESMRAGAGGKLLVADSKRIVAVDPQTAIVSELTPAGNSRVNILGAGANANGSILAADFDGNEVTVLQAMDTVAGGLFVQIERIVSDNFPLVTVELSVQDRLRNPITGLDQHNFLITENGSPAAEQTFLGYGAGIQNGQGSDVVVVFERSPETRALTSEMQTAIQDIAAALEGNGRIVSIISAGRMPVDERFNVENPASMEKAAGNSGAVNAGTYSAGWRFDMALRLAAGKLLPLSKKRAVVFVTSGGIGDAAFEDSDLSQQAAYLANNGIPLYAVLIGEGEISGELRYLCEETGGQMIRLYSKQGIGGAIRSIAEKPPASYIFTYRSSLQTNFGRAFLPVEAEVYLLENSGRDAAGYFPPLE
ncbi:MAG: NHL repeat-containing protein [Spirochaetaceae bacterium]|jgi:DNA-binding beta-propeller fold protein YncE|nr:NHL repeat-containing protein [Spirochaetaceae bacterium]